MKNKIVTRQEWLAARTRLLEAEKQLTRQSDAVARQRRELPWVRLSKPYSFGTEEGKRDLSGLFRGRSQLLIYHLMYGPEYALPCPSCSSIADSFDGITAHLAGHDVMLWAVSRAPLEKLLAFKRRMGWKFPWASSATSDFNYDFAVSFTPEQQRAGIEYNYRCEPGYEPLPSGADGIAGIAALAGTDAPYVTREARHERLCA